ncbi:hypothetical protein J2Y03_003466 [Neobacillus niacini]|uniref:dsDNA nuclease domain-containing protein n=1 Tax=Neobacillus niacini TaxID=86668 RepID=UPI0028554349|nr:dsDNA nuclease domain-containing protein [Neobacillus niacini]MDR7078414.1 hypothetical protein [Neobacillus niacini]
MDTREQILEHYISNDFDKDDVRQHLLDTEIKNKNSEEIANYLTSIPPEEMGGLTAISGFYYQFLVTIEYIIEMLAGKWDFVIMEHHDDVVVGKENHLRFIQVKTSEKVKVDVTASPASGLYSRSLKDKDGRSFRRNNSWVDKLLSNAEYAQSSAGFKTEFQLYASYHFIKTSTYNFDIYTGNKFYNKEIPTSDHLVNKISEQVCDKEGSPYSYFENCGESVNQLLSRFYIHTGLSLSDIELFQHHLCMKLNSLLFKDIGPGITMQVEDLHMLIGLLCNKCTYKSNPEILLITRDSVEDILGEIRNKSIAAASSAANKHDSIRITNRVIELLIEELDEYESIHIEFIKDKIYTYKDYLLEWISNGGNIRQVIERYIDGTTRTSIYSRLSDSKRETKLQDLFCVILILIIGRDSFLQFSNNNGILLKQCKNTEKVFSFLSLEKKRNLAFGLQKLESIIQTADLQEQLFLLDKDLSVVLQNYNDREFEVSEKWDINQGVILGTQGFQSEAKLNKVPLKANIIPGEMLKADFLDSLDQKTDIQENLKRIWEIYQGGTN